MPASEGCVKIGTLSRLRQERVRWSIKNVSYGYGKSEGGTFATYLLFQD